MAEQLKVAEPQQSKHRFNQEDDSACLKKWSEVLVKFHAIEESRPKDLDKKLDALVNEATSSHILTYRQVDGIVGRVRSVKDGSYGQSKKGIAMKTS